MELFHWFMNQRGEINGFTKAIWSGVTTLILARVVNWAIENEITGLYQVTNNESIDKFTLLGLIKKYTNLLNYFNNVFNPNFQRIIIDNTFSCIFSDNFIFIVHFYTIIYFIQVFIVKQ